MDPVDLIDRIPYGVKIKGLRDALVKILNDYRVQISLLDGSKRIMYGDCINLLEKQIRVVRQGVCVEGKWDVFFFWIFKSSDKLKLALFMKI